MKVIKLRIDPYKDREAIVPALAANGYKVWEEKINENKCYADTEHYVCFEYTAERSKK